MTIIIKICRPTEEGKLTRQLVKNEKLLKLLNSQEANSEKKMLQKNKTSSSSGDMCLDHVTGFDFCLNLVSTLTGGF